MKTARAMPPDLSSSSRRAQPARQARTNPSRASGSLLRSFGPGDAGSGLRNGPVQRDSVEIFPAITSFADAITALPKELVRHFTLLKEVDAKIFAPEDALHRLVHTALHTPIPEPTTQHLDAAGSTHSQQNTLAPLSVNGSIISGQAGSIASHGDSHDASLAVFDAANIPRRQLFRQCTYTMQEMLVSLDEKNHVLSTANECLAKHLRRIDDLYPHIEREISEEARFGSMTHWAYSENRAPKPADRTRREAPVISREAQLQAEEAAARSDARKAAMLAKKGRNNVAESDFDDNSNKKSHGNSKKSRPTDTMSSVGLGITNGTANGGPVKRRKVEKGPVGGAVMERSISGILPNASNSKGKNASPRETPIPEPKKRAKTSSAPNGQAKKRIIATNANPNISPALASSPLHSTFADASKAASRGSPLPTTGRPASGRARQNSTQSAADSSRGRPTTTPSSKVNGIADLSGVAAATGRTISEIKATMKESANNSKGEHMIEDSAIADLRGGLIVGTRKESLKREDTEVNGDAVMPTPPAVTTKSGRASKPSTPAIPQFPEPVRPRSSRTALEGTNTNKRSHKKGAGVAAQQLLAAQAADDEAMDSAQGDDDEEAIDADEPTYCYCNGVSYGEMVACDYDGCQKEWFHLGCVGLKTAPGKAKWYCDDCKEIMKGSKRFNGR